MDATTLDQAQLLEIGKEASFLVAAKRDTWMPTTQKAREITDRLAELTLKLEAAGLVEPYALDQGEYGLWGQ